MKRVYSVSKAKANLSALVRHVYAGNAVTITVRGKPVVEVRPVERKARTMAAHMRNLEARGILVPARAKLKSFKPGPPVPGAFARFMADR